MADRASWQVEGSRATSGSRRDWRQTRGWAARRVAVAMGAALCVLVRVAASPVVAAPGVPATEADAALASSRWPGLDAALTAALLVSVPDGRVEVLTVSAPARGCPGDSARAAPGVLEFEVPHAIDGSGRVAVKVTRNGAGAAGAGAGAGAGCSEWLWTQVRVVGSTPVARRALRAGEPLSDATVRVELREIRAGHVTAVLGQGAVADRFIGAGQVIEPAAVGMAGPRNGEALKVVLVSGGLRIEQNGHALACGRAQCAVLPSGKHVEGTLVGGQLMVSVP